MSATPQKIPPAPQWDLDSIFPGGSGSKEFQTHREKTKADLDTAKTMLKGLPEKITGDSIPAWTDFILTLQNLDENIDLVRAFSNCLTSQNVDDAEAQAIEAKGDLYHSQWQKLRTELEACSLKQSDEQWAMLLSEPRLKEITFYLNELRVIARSKMAPELESLALDLAVSGYHAWNRLYDKMAGDIKVDFTQDGKTEKVSMGQVATKMADPDRAVRRHAFEKMIEGWETQANLAGMTLNALSGFRLGLGVASA